MAWRRRSPGPRLQFAASPCVSHRQHWDDFFHLNRRVHTSLDAA